MEDNSHHLSIIIGLVLSVPLSIISNILTPRFQSWIDLRIQASKALASEGVTRYIKRRYANILKEYEQISEFSNNSILFNQFILVTIARSILYITTGIMSAYIFRVLKELGGETEVSIYGQLVVLYWFFMAAFMACRKAINYYNTIRRYSDYKKDTEAWLHKMSESISQQSHGA